MMQLIADIKAVMNFRGLSTQKLADKMFKDSGTVSRQLDLEKGNPTLASIVQIVEALDARLVIETEESIKAKESADVTAYRERISELGAEVNRLTEKTADLSARVERRDQIIAEQKAAIARLERMIDYKDEDIHRKDATLAKMIAKQDELREQIEKLRSEKNI